MRNENRRRALKTAFPPGETAGPDEEVEVFIDCVPF